LNFVFHDLFVFLLHHGQQFAIALADLVVRDEGVVLDATFQFIEDDKGIDAALFVVKLPFKASAAVYSAISGSNKAPSIDVPS
jgi:hypothetical protein